ncbi:MAG TPA: glycosyltransferase [Draconibacterium sp.]|nr:glycosyltransferase [Draconibacterium sp.]
MSEAIIITPVKDSIETTRLTVDAISKARGNFEYYVFNDFSGQDTRQYLEQVKKEKGFQVIHLEEIIDTPSPNYRLVLEIAQKIALEKNLPLIIVESDVVIQPETLQELLQIQKSKTKAGIVGAITVDNEGQYNFPYTFEKAKSSEVINTSHSLSFCCTLLAPEFLEKFDFKTLSPKKDWYDVFISRQSKKLGFNNYLAKGTEVLHLPHSSRPWKNLKYKNPVLYYLRKYFYNRDRI